ncbi:hypothetical protein BpHYR1_036830 [Brachionus plicatilis]|uniref:Uncharacterized protein n=1 Tax=Brachionus plicatilis TaxID=10195 RepID=A0A3M7RGM3_BRAPC|nr:hypothetical protein BpHYR1_036830 [Brachionus plicatilis]
MKPQIFQQNHASIFRTSTSSLDFSANTIIQKFDRSTQKNQINTVPDQHPLSIQIQLINA